MEKEEKQNNFSVDFKLTDVQKRIVAEVTNLIIPKTDTVGALETGVPQFIEMMLKDCYSKLEHTNFIAGIDELEKLNFLEMDNLTKSNALRDLEIRTKKVIHERNVNVRKGDSIKQEPIGTQSKGLPFWRLMKELTLLGYFTSEKGIKENFEYVQVPGKLENIKIKPNQKSFAY